MPVRPIILISIIISVVAAVTGYVPNSPSPASNIPKANFVSQLIASPSAKPASSRQVPTISFSSPFPENLTTASAFVVYSPTTKTFLLKKNEHLRLMPASTTKMMTALIAVNDYDQNEIITINRAVNAISKSTKFELGQQFTLESLIKAALINSGNDAALAIADHHSLGYQGFINRMNQQAQSWGLKNTHFANVSGVEQEDHYASAADLAIIADHLISNPFLASIVTQNNATIHTIDGKKTIVLKNTNELLSQIEGIKGIKTGWTENAGECLVTYVDRDFDIITVMLNSQDRFGETQKIIEWVYANAVVN